MSAQEQKTILLVEDEALIAMAEAEAIRRFGYNKVIIANSGEKAVRLATENREIDLVLMDINLGKGIDGTEAARQILSRRTIPIVFLTSHSEQEYVERVKEITRYGYVTKDCGNFVLQSSIGMAFELFEAHERTKASETKYRRLHETMTDAFVLVDMTGRILEANQSFIHMLGYSMEELACLTYQDLTPEKWHSIESVIIDEQIMVRGFSDVYEKEYVRKDGAVFPVELRTFLIDDEERNLLGMWAIVRDITDRKQSETRLRESEEMMRYIVRHDPNAIAVYDRDLHYIAVSDRYLQDYDVKEADILGKHHYEVFPEMPQKWKDVHQRCLAGAIERNDDDYFERPDGSVTYNRWECRPWYRADGQIGGMITYTEVTTGRKKAEMALRESEENYRGLFQNASIGIFHSLPEGRFLRVNPALAQMMGYASPEEMVSAVTNIKTQIYVDSEKHSDLLTATRKSTGWVHAESRYRRKDGTIIIANVTVRKVLNADGAIAFLEGFVENITERKEVEERIKSVLFEKELLLHEVHHRIKNNMNVIMSMLLLQAETLQDPLAVAALADSRSRLQGMMVLYDKLYRSTDFRQISTKDYLASLIDEILRNFSTRGSVTVEPHIDDVILDANTLSSLGMILNELLTNTMKHAFIGLDRGLIGVSFSVKENRATLIVYDNGTGIPESVDIAASTGFGMQLVGLLTEQLDGTIRLERRHGSKFVLEFGI
ncbi:MAG TPA: PAS domain S-box protein [Syntrophorhabdaceae bacterium]